jgi:predicted small lipoprotein YifL
MKSPGKRIISALFIGAFLAVLSGCTKEGPAEKAGKEVDKAAETVGQKIEQAGESIKDAAQGNKK